MKLIFPAIFHHEDNSYWVEFPDLPGCQSFGDTQTETLFNAEEALEAHTLSLPENGGSLPKASDIESLNIEKNCFVSMIVADLSPYMNSSKAVKKTLTIPEWLNNAAMQKGINFSRTLQDALIQKLNV